MTTLYSIPSGTADEHTTLAVLRADLLAATNFANTLHDEIVRLRDTITEQRQEIEDLSQFTQLARDAVNELNDEDSAVVLTRYKGVIATLRARLTVDAAMRQERAP